jgi:hypothetical protein
MASIILGFVSHFVNFYKMSGDDMILKELSFFTFKIIFGRIYNIKFQSAKKALIFVVPNSPAYDIEFMVENENLNLEQKWSQLQSDEPLNPDRNVEKTVEAWFNNTLNKFDTILGLILKKDFSVTNVHIRFQDVGEEKLNFGILISNVNCKGDKDKKEFDL